MEILIAILGLILGGCAGYVLGMSGKNRYALEASELKNLIKEKELNFNKILSEKENSFKTLSEEKEKSYSLALEEKEKTYNDKLELLKDSHKKDIQVLENNHKILLETMEKRQNESMNALKEQFSSTSASLSEQLKSTTEEMLKKRQEEFSVSSEEKIEKILGPLKNSLTQMQEKVSENTKHHSELGGKLAESIKNLLDHTESAQASADKLAGMLKGNTRYQGTWGEKILQEILESFNFKEGIHFETQQTMRDEKGNLLKNDEGKKMKPDIILHLDQNKDIIIDSKVSLTDYLKYQEAETDQEREEALKRHILSIENHVKELAKKDYSNFVAAPRVRMGYVIMFIPNTSALHLATGAKPTLWREAMAKNVYIADEQTLYAALKIISLTWQHINQAENHREIFKLADEMLNRVSAFMTYFAAIGKNLENASDSYNSGLKKLQEGGKSIPKVCRNLINLGARPPQPGKGVNPELLGLSETGTF